MEIHCTILTIDDSSSAHEIVQGVLEPEGLTLLFAEDGEQGLAMARELLPDIILLDVVMPGMDGFETCRAIRSNPRLAEVPVLMITSLEDRASRIKGIEAGADDFISKPFDADELIVRIQSIARLNRYRKLHAERSKFEWVIQHSENGHLALDPMDNILYANRKAKLLLGLSDIPSDAAESGKGPKFLPSATREFTLQPEEGWAGWPLHSSQTPLYLVRPETESSPPLWLSVDVFEQPGAHADTRLIRLTDATGAMTNQRDIWTFQSMISHKLRTPLSGILFSLDLLASGKSGLSEVETLQMINMAKSNAQRLYDQIEDILGYLDQPGAAASDDRFMIDSFAPMAQQVRTGLSIRSTDLTLEPVVEHLSERALTISARSMEWILLELFENAVKNHPHNTPHLEVGILPCGPQGQLTPKAGYDCVLFTVADDGPGLTPEQLNSVWTPYFQGEKTHTFEVEGMGLGLAKIATIVWGAGGTCRIANRAGTPGAVVELVLPLAPTA